MSRRPGVAGTIATGLYKELMTASVYRGGTARRETASALKLLPLSRHSGHGQTCYWLDPIAIDPIRT